MHRSLGDAAWLTATGAARREPDASRVISASAPTWSPICLENRSHSDSAAPGMSGAESQGPALAAVHPSPPLGHGQGEQAGPGGPQVQSGLLSRSPMQVRPAALHLCAIPLAQTSPLGLPAPPTFLLQGVCTAQPRHAPSQLNPRRPGYSITSADSRGRPERLRAGRS